MGVFSVLLKKINGPGQLLNLTRAGYMSPQQPIVFQGQGFACNNCDHKRPPYDLKMGEPVGFCAHPSINANVELAGCCDRFSYKGVHTS